MCWWASWIPLALLFTIFKSLYFVAKFCHKAFSTPSSLSPLPSSVLKWKASLILTREDAE